MLTGNVRDMTRTRTPLTDEQTIARFGENSLSCLTPYSGMFQDERIADGYLTLGELRDLLASVDPHLNVVTDTGMTLGEVSSYRGYYVDAAFAPSTLPQNTAGALALVEATIGSEFESWKGGCQIRMNTNTPVWLAVEGEATGIHFTGYRMVTGGLVLVTANEYDAD